MVKVQYIFCFFLLLNFCSNMQVKNSVKHVENLRTNDDMPTLREKIGYDYGAQVKDFQEINTFHQNPPLRELLKETIYIISVEEFVDDVNFVGKKGALALNTSFIDENNLFDKSNIESQTTFKNIIKSKEEKEYEINCRLFKYTHFPLIVLCELDENIPQGNYSINFNNINFMYNDKEIIVNSSQHFDFEKLDSYIPDLYSDEQNITVENNKESIEIKFKIISYHNETIVLWGTDENLEILDNCKVENNELICLIQKKTLLEIMPNPTGNFYLIYCDNKNYDSTFYRLVDKIIINYYGIEKEDIFIGINKLVEDKLGSDSFVAYETNITNIPNFRTGLISFSLKFGGVEEHYCGFKKYDDTPLLLLCGFINYSTNETYLSEIEKEIILDNNNIKYNLRIQPVKNNQKIDCNDLGQFYLGLYYPKILDFTNQDKINITFTGKFELKNDNPSIRLNLNADNLECEEKSRFLICIVSKSHFEGRKSGYYYPIHVNNLNEKHIFYNNPPIKVILNDESKAPDEKKGGLVIKTFLIIVFSVIGGIILIIGIIFLFRCFKRNDTKTDVEKGVPNMELLES